MFQNGNVERGQGKNIIQENIVWTKNMNLGWYVDSFELLRFFEVKFCINQSLIKEKIVIYA